MLKCLVCHDWTKVGAANADVDDVANPCSRMPFPLSAAHTIRKLGHAVEHGVDLRYDVLPVHKHRFIFRSTQSNVKDRALFSDVDLLAAEHRVNAGAQTAVHGELEEKLKSLIGD